MIKAVILDFDGVIVDSERKKLNDMKKLLKTYGIDSQLNLRDILGRKTIMILDAHFPGLSKADKHELIQKRRKILLSECDPAIPGVIEFVINISGEFTLAVCSGTRSQIINRHLEQFGIGKHFAEIIGGDCFKNSKPKPEPYLVALQRLKITSKEAVAIEDSQAGIDSALAAGCNVIGLDTYNTGLKKAKVFRNFADLEKKIRLYLLQQ